MIVTQNLESLAARRALRLEQGGRRNRVMTFPRSVARILAFARVVHSGTAARPLRTDQDSATLFGQARERVRGELLDDTARQFEPPSGFR